MCIIGLLLELRLAETGSDRNKSDGRWTMGTAPFWRIGGAVVTDDGRTLCLILANTGNTSAVHAHVPCDWLCRGRMYYKQMFESKAKEFGEQPLVVALIERRDHRTS
jgi:hypothetical protein